MTLKRSYLKTSAVTELLPDTLQDSSDESWWVNFGLFGPALKKQSVTVAKSGWQSAVVALSSESLSQERNVRKPPGAFKSLAPKLLNFHDEIKFPRLGIEWVFVEEPFATLHLPFIHLKAELEEPKVLLEKPASTSPRMEG